MLIKLNIFQIMYLIIGGYNTKTEPKGLSEIIDCKQYSSVNRLLRVTAYALRIVKYIEKNTDDNNDKTNASTTLSGSEICSPETL